MFEGISPLTGQKIVCIITGLKTSTSNEKTGDMLQTWILLQDHKPNEAHKNGLKSLVSVEIAHTLVIIMVLVTSNGFRHLYKFGSHIKQMDVMIISIILI